MKLALITIGLMAITFAAPSTVRAGDKAATKPSTRPVDQAEQVARQYLAQMKSKHFAKAYETYWDMNVLFDNIFGDDMKQQSAGDRADMAKALIGYYVKTNSESKTAAAWAKSTIDGYDSHELEDHRVSVDYSMKTPDGAVASTLFVAKVDDKWCIVDTTIKGKNISDSIRADYRKHSHEYTPAQYIRWMAEQAK